MNHLYRLIWVSLCAALLFGPVLTAAAQFGGPDPVLTKTMLPQRPKIGEPARITIVATNRGNANAENVVITDPLPDNIALAGVSASQGNVEVAQRIITVRVGTLAPGQTVTVTNEVVILSEFASDTPYTNCTGLTYRDGTARLACFPVGPVFNPVSVTSPPRFLPNAGSVATALPLGLMVAGAGVTCLLAARRLRRSPIP
ncbi:MAG TPA: DUF11 domain-containing protein [Anaerolineae bacterium]|nr:DUF11 domain-containing protein [Anaerolineae bacterium]